MSRFLSSRGMAKFQTGPSGRRKAILGRDQPKVLRHKKHRLFASRFCAARHFIRRLRGPGDAGECARRALARGASKDIRMKNSAEKPNDAFDSMAMVAAESLTTVLRAKRVRVDAAAVRAAAREVVWTLHAMNRQLDSSIELPAELSSALSPELAHAALEFANSTAARITGQLMALASAQIALLTYLAKVKQGE
jgi:hypothetical protein